MKITKYILSLAAAVGMIAGCQKAELVQMLPAEDIVAPVLADLPESIVITPKNMAIDTVEFVWTKADFGAPTQVTYALEVSEANGDKKAVISSGITDTTAVLLYEAINVALYEGLELPDGVASAVNFYVSAYTGESAKVYSAPVAVTVTPTAAEKTYPMIYMPGSYQDWKPDQAPAKFQVLYDFTGTGVFEGIADFITSPDESRAWKFTPEPDWDFDWGIPKDATPEAEAAEVTLINNDGGDRSDINIYTAKRFYHFTMDTNTGLLKHNYSFDQVGVVGELTGWADGADKVMEFNAAKRRFYVDVEGLKGMFKFRLDGKWDKNWGASDFGVEVSNGDGNLEAEEGNYRVYLYLSNSGALAYELSASMYGKEEPVGGNVVEPEEPETPETPAVKGWGLVGEYNGWGEQPDVILTSDGTYLVAKSVALSGQVKFRKDADWATNFGAPGEVEPVELTANAETELVANGKNFTIAEGTYDVYLDEVNAKAWFINDGSYPGGGAALEMSEWGLIGSLAACNNWGANIPLFVDGNYSVAKGVVFAAGDEFKFRKGETWGVELTYEGQITVDARLDLIDGTGGKQNSSIAEGGTYDVFLANDLSAFYVMTPGKTPADAGAAPEVPDTPKPEAPVVTENAIAADVTALEEDSIYGAIGVNNDWNNDIMLKKTSDENVFVAKGVEFTADGAFKVRKAGGWDDTANFGLESYGEVLEINKGYVVITSGGSKDMKVPAGTYDIWFHLEKMHVYIMEAGIHPSTAGEGAAPEVPDTPKPEAPVVTENAIAADVTALEEDSIYGAIGVNNDWNNDIMLKKTSDENVFVAKGVEFTADGAFKVRKAGGWDDTANFGLESYGEVLEINKGYVVITSGGSKDMKVPAGTYDIWFHLEKMHVYVMEAGKHASEAE